MYIRFKNIEKSTPVIEFLKAGKVPKFTASKHLYIHTNIHTYLLIQVHTHTHVTLSVKICCGHYNCTP